LKLILVLILLYTNSISAFNPLEPSIECTVIKVLSPQKVFGFDKFPLLYQSINNNPPTSKLYVGGKEFFKVDPVSLFKTHDFERLLIESNGDKLELELKGRPISRNGKMTINGKLAAEVTCH